MSTWDLDGTRRLVFACHGSSCRKRDAEALLDVLRDELAAHGADDVHVIRTRCVGRCDDAPNLLVEPDGCWYAELTAKLARRVVREHLVAGHPIDDALGHAREDGVLRRRGKRARGKSRRARG
ncbi:MAG: (2Fe-2S) ferredoxin domain-containing protein [Gemmatimonadales bacterium]|nr:(2Fe-2S) ferredoxin domain-containing protein [Gemmatimonadales bacterium]